MTRSYDVVVVGGAVIGSAVAYFLAADPHFRGSVLVVERDATYRTASTALSAAGIRTQFSSAINVKIGLYGGAFIRSFGETMQVGGDRPDLAFREAGYLFLATSPEQEARLRENHALQTALGADVVLWDRSALADAFPHLAVADVRLASYGRSGEGWFSNTGMMNGFRNKARALGAHFVEDEVVAMERSCDRVAAVTLRSGSRIAVGTVVNASGARAARTAALAGLHVPVEPRKRTVFVFDCQRSPEGTAGVNGGRLPLMIDPTGVWVRPDGRVFLTGCAPAEDPAVDVDDFAPRYDEFDEVVWPALAARSPAFEALKVVGHWAGHYDYNTLDQNLIVGPHPEVANFVFANGFSGHGLQQAPAVGRAVAETISYGGYRTLDLSDLGYERVLANRPFLERAVI